MNQIRSSLLAVVALALLTSCSSGSGKDGGLASGGSGGDSATAASSAHDDLAAASSPADASPDAEWRLSCDLVSAAELSASVGISGFTGPQAVESGTATVHCNYDLPNGNFVTLYYYPGESRSTFDQQRADIDFKNKGYPSAEVTGIGDAAYSLTLPIGSFTLNSVTFLKGSIIVYVTTSTDGFTLDQIKKVATLVASKL